MNEITMHNRQLGSRFILIFLGAAALSLASGNVAAADPTIFWASDPVNPGDTVLVVGDGLEGIERVEVRTLHTGEAPSAEAPRWASVPTNQSNAHSLKFTIPDGLDPGIFQYRMTSATGSVTELLNAPTPYWIQGDNYPFSTAGGWISINGRNIVRSDTAHLRMDHHSGSSIRISSETSAARLWTAHFPVPKDAILGEYKLSLWNGQGTTSTFTSLGTWIIRKPAAEPTSIDSADLIRFSDGSEDATARIQTALDKAARSGGGTVTLPRGRYLVSETLRIPPYVHLRGINRATVALVWPDFTVPPPALIEGASNFSVSHLTIYASNHRHIISGGFSRERDERPRNITISNVLIRASAYRGHLSTGEVHQRFEQALQASTGGGDSVRLTGDNIHIYDSDIYGSGRSLYLFDARGVVIQRNIFYNGRLGWYSISGSSNVIFSENTIYGGDLQSTGGGINTLGDNKTSENILLLRNSFRNLNGWDREAVTSDGPGALYYGPVKYVDDMTLELTFVEQRKGGEPASWIGMGLYIVGGRGMGQHVRIGAFDGKHVTLQSPLIVPPDDSSLVTVAPLHRNYIFASNSVIDAGVAIQLYGASVNTIIADNTSTRTGGFIASGRWYHGYQPNWYTQIVGNRIAEGNTYRGGSNNSTFAGEAVIRAEGVQRAPNRSPLSFATIVRSNTLENNAHIEIRGYDAHAPGLVDAVVEGNIVRHANEGIVVDDGAQNVFVRNNDTRLVGLPKH